MQRGGGRRGRTLNSSWRLDDNTPGWFGMNWAAYVGAKQMAHSSRHYNATTTTARKDYSGLVSVVTASCNSVNHIEKAVQSVAGQSCMPLEHIVVDDGSTDGTVHLLRKLAERVPGLKVISRPNQGAGPARNAAIEIAEGRYIAFLDSDDVWLENKLERQVAFMEETGEPFTYGDYTVADGATWETLGRYETPQRLTYRDLLTRCPIACSTAAYNQQALGKRFMPAIRRGQDWALWLALTRNGRDAVKSPGCEVIYHKVRGSLSAKKVKKAIDMYRIYSGEEKLGAFRSAYLLARHTVNVVSKRPGR
jgi:teichuronic acid biosynthesis glycosyltransferase TuaG